MAGRRCILTDQKNYYIVDACFLANKYIPTNINPRTKEQENEIKRIKACKAWWKIIEDQLDKEQARVYIPDICIAEVIKTLSKKLYNEEWFKDRKQHNRYFRKFTKDVQMTHGDLKKKNRIVRYHDISTSRDILISVERFNKIFTQKGINKVSVPDLIIVATAKYLMDFFDIPYKYLHIITLDNHLRKGSKKISEIPSAYDPTKKEHSVDKIFR